VTKTTAFWDVSALVPLCVHESSTRQAQSFLRRFAPVVWWGSPVEVASAICRLHRAGDLSDSGKQGALARLQLLSQGCREILPTQQLRDIAVRCLETHSLRSADSLQLAASLVWCDHRPSRRHFICADHRPSQAAKTAGFSLLQLSVTAP
jgi:predicted nucleic acid-binding protein